MTWDEVAAMCAALAAQLRGTTFDAVLGIARGGLVPTALLAQELGIRNVLVADDIWDSGRTIHAVRERAESCGARVTVAVLHYKPSRSHFPLEQPDHWCRETDAWVLYPWERDP